MWKSVHYKAYALFPYTSTHKGHLNITRGDVLDVIKETGEWVFGKNISNGCLGICPSNYTQKYISDYDTAFRVIETEIKFLPTNCIGSEIQS